MDIPALLRGNHGRCLYRSVPQAVKWGKWEITVNLAKRVTAVVTTK